jgi:hypothetical protein
MGGWTFSSLMLGEYLHTLRRKGTDASGSRIVGANLLQYTEEEEFMNVMRVNTLS